LNFESKTHESQLEYPKAKEGHLEGEAAKPTSGMKSGKTKERVKKSSKLNSP
jgi:hypothetical protein